MPALSTARPHLWHIDLDGARVTLDWGLIQDAGNGGLGSDPGGHMFAPLAVQHAVAAQGPVPAGMRGRGYRYHQAAGDKQLGLSILLDRGAVPVRFNCINAGNLAVGETAVAGSGGNGFPLHVFLQAGVRIFGATAAAGRNFQLFLEFFHRADTFFDSLLDLLVGDGAAKANVHGEILKHAVGERLKAIVVQIRVISN